MHKQFSLNMAIDHTFQGSLSWPKTKFTCLLSKLCKHLFMKIEEKRKKLSRYPTLRVALLNKNCV